MAFTGGLDTKKGETHNGIMAMYNLCADHELQLGQVAVRRIPCACLPCMAQLKTPIKEQYSDSTNCEWYSIFEGFNERK